MDRIFYSKVSSDWFFYYIVLCIYGFLLNFATPFVGVGGSFDEWGGESIYYFIGIFLGIVAFIFVPIQIRKNKIKENKYYKSSNTMTFTGWVIVVIFVLVNINSTLILLIFSAS